MFVVGTAAHLSPAIPALTFRRPGRCSELSSYSPLVSKDSDDDCARLIALDFQYGCHAAAVDVSADDRVRLGPSPTTDHHRVPSSRESAPEGGLHGKRIRFTDAERVLLARKAKAVEPQSPSGTLDYCLSRYSPTHSALASAVSKRNA
jgi:hypothetical protein